MLLLYHGAMKKNAVKNDILLILAALLLAGAIWAILTLTKQQGAEAIVTVDGAVLAVLPLAEDTVYTVAADGGEDGNVIVIDGGRVCVQTASCPDKICVRQGWISRDGESIVCLPHKLVVSIRGRAQAMDAYAA